MNHRNPHYSGQRRSRGFSTLELLLVMVVSLVVAALAIPKFEQVRRTLRISGDARDLNGAVNLAKLRAAADFTETRVYIDLGSSTTTSNTFHVDTWNRTNNCWHVVGDLNNPCFVPGVSPVQTLSTGVSFGFGGVAAPPPNTQATLQQGTARFSCTPVTGKRIGQSSPTACVQFSSRGIPLDINNGGVPTGQGAFYITDNAQVYAVTVGAAGLSQVWAINIIGNGNTNGWYRK